MKGALDGAAIAQMPQDFLTNQLALAVTVGREDHLIATLLGLAGSIAMSRACRLS